MENKLIFDDKVHIEYEKIEYVKKLIITIATFFAIFLVILFFAKIIHSVPEFFVELMVHVTGNEWIVYLSILLSAFIASIAPFLCVYIVCMSAFGFNTIEKIKKYVYLNPTYLYKEAIEIDRLDVAISNKKKEDKNK